MQEEFDNTAEKKENLDTQENIIEKNPTNKKTTTFNILLIVAIFIVLLIYMLKVDGIDNIIKILKTVDYKWVFLGGLCLLVHWSCEGLNLHIPIKRIYKDQPLHSGRPVFSIIHFLPVFHMHFSSQSMLLLKVHLNSQPVHILHLPLQAVPAHLHARSMRQHTVSLAGYACPSQSGKYLPPYFPS